MIDSIKTRKDIVNYWVERWIIEEKESWAQEILSLLGKDKFKKAAFSTIIDAQKRKGKNPRMTGTLQDADDVFKSTQEKNPEKYLSTISKRLSLLLEAEEEFLNKFVHNNTELSDEAKDILKRTISLEKGRRTKSWSIDNVWEKDDVITIESGPWRHFLYFPQDKQKFLEEFVVNNEDLSDEAKIVLHQHVNEWEGPRSTRGNVKKVREENGKITVETRHGASYLYLPEDKQKFLDGFLVNN